MELSLWTIGEPGSEDYLLGHSTWMSGRDHDGTLPSPGDEYPTPVHPTYCFLEGRSMAARVEQGWEVICSWIITGLLSSNFVSYFCKLNSLHLRI